MRPAAGSIRPLSRRRAQTPSGLGSRAAQTQSQPKVPFRPKEPLQKGSAMIMIQCLARWICVRGLGDEGIDAGDGGISTLGQDDAAGSVSYRDGVVPWPVPCALIEPVYPKPGNGRPPVGVERMLRIYLLQHWFNLSDPAVEEAL